MSLRQHFRQGIFHIYANKEDEEQDKPVPFEVNFSSLPRYKWHIKIAGARSEHFCGRHATPLCNDC